MSRQNENSRGSQNQTKAMFAETWDDLPQFIVPLISHMRHEHPDIWERIDAMCDGRFDPSEFKQLLYSDRMECESCGYNLFGNASGVCPECGTPIHLTPELRRTISIRIFDTLRSGDPDKWRAVSQGVEEHRKRRLKQEFELEGERRDQIRRNALKRWLKRDHGEAES